MCSEVKKNRKEKKNNIIAMKRFYILLFMAFTFSVVTFAQGNRHGNGKHNGRHKELVEFRMKFMAQEMKLDKDQQKKFYSIYPEFLKEKREATSAVRKMEKKIKNDKNATEADFKALEDARSKAKNTELNIEKKYDAKFSSFLSSKQIYKWKEAENKFREKMKEMRNKRKNK